MNESLLNRLPPFLPLTSAITVDMAVRYLAFAGLAWLLGYALFRRRWIHRKIVEGFPGRADVRREIGWSLVSAAVFGLTGAAVLAAARHGWTRLYWRIGDRGWEWFWLSIVVTIFLHDAYFYWTHRLMHLPALFNAFHRVHHLSRNPTPWASYAFSPPEALVQAGIYPLVVMVLPMHPFAFSLFMFWQILFNVLGHTGYEFHPHGLMRSPLRFFLNTPTNHIMHHEKFRGNYGLYFNLWDRLMGTNHADYESRYREVTGRVGEIRNYN